MSTERESAKLTSGSIEARVTRIPALIIGAGLQGCCIALELARRGHEVTILDRDRTAMNRASRRNEGKIHTGLLYAADRSFESAELQLQGSLRFDHLLRRWIGSRADELAVSSRFFSVVATDSLLGPDELAEHYARVEQRYRDLIDQDRSLNYLGTRPSRLARRVDADTLEMHFNPSSIQAAFETAEQSVDTDRLADLVVDALDAMPQVQFLPGRSVREIHRLHDGFRVEGDGDEGFWRLDATQVVNASWDSRFALDEQVGLEIADGWLHRLKYRVIVRLPEDLQTSPSATMILGRYGDVVVRTDGTGYLSWYPLCLRGWSNELTPPDDWTKACRGETSDEERAFARSIIEAIDDWYPGIGRSTPVLIDAGVIVAYGTTDVDDQNSELHHRTTVGVRSAEGFYSVDPGKLTTAPLFAERAASQISREA